MSCIVLHALVVLCRDERGQMFVVWIVLDALEGVQLKEDKVRAWLLQIGV